MTNQAIADALRRHRAAERKKLTLIAGLLIVAAISLVFDIATGPALLPVSQVVAALVDPAGVDSTIAIIVWTLRLPMALMAIVVGIALGSSGATMQTLLDNPLASPYTLGLASAAGFGASLAILAGGWGINPLLIVPASAFVMACLASAVIYGVGNMRGMMGDTMILAGIALMFLFHSLQSLLQFHAVPEVGQQIVFWMFGTLSKASWTNLAITAVAVGLSLPVLMLNAWKLTALKLGEERARSVGISVSGLRLITIALVSLMTATAISFVGTIGFIGLVAPHIARMLVGEDQRYLLPAAGCVGAVMLSLASVLSKVIMPGVLLPVGIVTAIIGVPFFLHLILRRARRRA
ncbi:MAG: FecCD family ABC transporter permease [Phyllobacterium sp.]